MDVGYLPLDDRLKPPVDASTTAEAEAGTKAETEAETETETETEAGTEAETEAETETETEAVTEAETEAGMGVESEAKIETDLKAKEAAETTTPKPTSEVIVTNTPHSLLPLPCTCCNTTINNLNITVSGTAMEITGSVERLDLTWVVAQCPQVTSLTLRVGAESVAGYGAGLSWVRSLDLSGNALDKVPDSVVRLEGLRVLTLAENNISKLPQKQLEKLFHRLDYVDIRGKCYYLPHL